MLIKQRLGQPQRSLDIRTQADGGNQVDFAFGITRVQLAGPGQ